MSYWSTSLSFAILLVTIPFSFVLRVLLQLPRPLAACHRRWPLPVNLALIGAVTVCATIFIRSGYYGRRQTSLELIFAFFIVAVAYAFGLVLLLRQFSGVYQDYIVTTGSTGLGLRKVAYRSMQKVETVRSHAGETELSIETTRGTVPLTLPTRYVSIFHDQMRKGQQADDL